MGLEFSRELAARACDLVLVSNREDELDAAREALSKEFPVQVRTRYQDLARQNSADGLFDWCAAEGISPDIGDALLHPNRFDLPRRIRPRRIFG